MLPALSQAAARWLKFRQRSPLGSPRQLQLLVVLTLLSAATLPASAQPTAPAVPPERTTASGLRSKLNITSRDRLLNAALVQAAEDAYRKLQPLLRLPKFAPYPIELEVVPGNGRVPDEVFPLRMVVVRDAPTFMAKVSLEQPEAREAFVRTLVHIFLYEKLLHAHPEYLEADALPILPLWLTEGTFQTLNDRSQQVWDLVIAQAVAGRRAPDLATTMSWVELSGEPVARAWQQAFSHYLLQSVAAPGDGRVRFHKWLEKPKEELDGALWPLENMMPSEIEWRSHLANSRERSQPTVLGWDKTASALAALQTIQLSGKDDEQPKIMSLDEISQEIAALPINQEPLAAKRAELMGLEMRAHFLWRPVITTFRLALNSATDPKAKPSYGELLSLAQGELTKLSQATTKLTDYINWFEITASGDDGISAFTPYRRLRLHLDSLDTRKNDALQRGVVKVEGKLRR